MNAIEVLFNKDFWTSYIVSNDRVFLKLWIGKTVERKRPWLIEIRIPTIPRTF